jgi:hypothetical protein
LGKQAASDQRPPASDLVLPTSSTLYLVRGSLQRIAMRWRRSVAAIGFESKLRYRELRFDHLRDQAVFVAQKLHHFRRRWSGSASLDLQRFHPEIPLIAQQQSADNAGEHRSGQQPSRYGRIPWHHCFLRLFKRTSEIQTDV